VLADFADFFAFLDFQSIFQWKYPGGIKWKLLHTKKPAFYKGMLIDWLYLVWENFYPAFLIKISRSYNVKAGFPLNFADEKNRTFLWNLNYINLYIQLPCVSIEKYCVSVLIFTCLLVFGLNSRFLTLNKEKK